MSLGQGNAVATPRLHQIAVTNSVNGIVIKIVYGQARVQQDLLWTGDLVSGSPYNSSGGKGLGKNGGGYEYYAAVLGLLCQGPIFGIANIWATNGRLTLSSASEPYTVPPGGGSYTVSQSALFAQDQGVGKQAAYSVTANDYGSPGPVVLSGTQTHSLTAVSGTPGAGQYSQTGGTYNFSAAEAGSSVTINYVFSLYTLGETEDYNVPNTGPYEITVQYQTQFVSDEGVIYVTTGLPLTPVSGSPGVGQYNPNGGNYQFNAGDATQAVAISYTWKQSDSDVDPTATLSFTLLEGEQGQAPWTYLTSNHASQALGYSTLAMTGTPKMDLGESAQMPNFNYEVVAQFQFGAGIVDADAALVIADFLTNPIYGAGFQGVIDSSLQGILRNYWNANSYFVSPVIDQANSAAELVEQLLEAGSAEWFWSEGKLKFATYGDTTTVGNGFTFTPATQPVFDFNDDDYLGDASEDPVQVERKPECDNYNAVKIQFSNRINNYNPDIVQEFDDYSIGQNGLNQEDQKDYSFLKTQTAATFAANLRLKRLVYINATYKFQVSAIRYGALEPMDLVTLTDEDQGLDKTPVRITEIEEDDGFVLNITAEEFPWGTASATLYPKEPANPYQPTGSQTSPGDTSAYIFETTPQNLNGGQNTLQIATTGGPNWGGCDVWVSSDGTDYGIAPVGRIQGTNRIGVITTLLPVSADPDTTDTLGVDLSLSAAELQSVTLADADKFVTLSALINSDGTVELISYETATLTSAFNYNLAYIRRGVYGSTIGSHPIGTNFSRLDDGLFQYQYPAQYAGKTIYIKLTSFNLFGVNEQSLADVTAIPFTVPGTTLGAPGKGSFVITPANPLTAQAIGTSAQITCSPFTASFNGVSVSCNPSGPITGLNQSQGYYVYYVDPAFAGGSITPIATQNTADFTGKAGYYYLGQISTPTTGGTQYRPKSFSDIGTNTTQNPTYAYDLNPTSGATLKSISTPVAGSYSAVCQWFGDPNIVAGSTQYVIASATIGTSGSGTAAASLFLSFDGGATFTTLHSFSSTTAQATYSIAVPPGTNLSQIIVQGNTQSNATAPGSSGSATLVVNDIYVQ